MPWRAISGSDASTGVVFLPLGGHVGSAAAALQQQQQGEPEGGNGTISLLDRLSGLSLNELEQRIDRILSEDPAAAAKQAQQRFGSGTQRSGGLAASTAAAVV